MSNDEKFTVYTRANDWRTAAGNIYHFSNWRSLGGMRRSDNEPQDGAEYRVTVERIEPDPDAEAEKRWWYCRWDNSGLFTRNSTWSNQVNAYITWGDGEVVSAAVTIYAATEPTFATFVDAVKEMATGVEIPQPEENKWWWWSGKEWDPIGGSPTMHQAMLWHGESKCWVFGTRDTIDAKRDALLAAAREAGKP